MKTSYYCYQHALPFHSGRHLQPFYYGEGTESVKFYILRADGQYHLGVEYRGCLKDILRVLRAFRRARLAVPGSSRGLFGGGFKAGSLRWLACYTCLVKVERSDRAVGVPVLVRPRCDRRVHKLVF